MLEVPQVSIHPIAALRAALGEVVEDEVASVHQIFPDRSPATRCSSSITRRRGDAEGAADRRAGAAAAVDASAREVLTEVGNILLNACLGTFGNLLQVQVSFSVPRLNLDTLHGVLESLTVDRGGCATRSSCMPGSGCATPK